MITPKQFKEELHLIIKNALREDIGEGDHTSRSTIPTNAHGKAKLLVKDVGIIAGVEFANNVFNQVDSTLEVTTLIQDGSPVKYGDIVFCVSGNSQSILQAERIVLNAMQRMSAIATKTRFFVDALKDTKTQVLDTRKTTLGIRALEKWAVSIGGGVNHRFALYDMMMIKDNHIDFAGGITQAITKAKIYLKENNLNLKIIVEARSLNEIEEILSHDGIHRILIDNFDFDTTKAAVRLINGRCGTESSGGINENTIRQYAECGVDYISCGALTHSVHNMDLSLKAIL